LPKTPSAYLEMQKRKVGQGKRSRRRAKKTLFFNAYVSIGK